jgi:hypothetical protein
MEEKPFVLVCTANAEVRGTIVYILRRLSYPHACWAHGEELTPEMNLFCAWIVLIGPCYNAEEGESILTELKSRHIRTKPIFIRDPFSPRFQSLTTAEEIPVQYPRISLPLNLAQLNTMLIAA